MEISSQEADIYCRMELKSCGLKDFSIVWIEKSNTLGLCAPWDKQIKISKECLRSAELLRWVVIHEIVHALDWFERGCTFERNGRNDFHGKSFKRLCKKMGIRPDRCIDFKYLSHL